MSDIMGLRERRAQWLRWTAVRPRFSSCCRNSTARRIAVEGLRTSSRFGCASPIADSLTRRQTFEILPSLYEELLLAGRTATARCNRRRDSGCRGSLSHFPKLEKRDSDPNFDWAYQ